MNTLAYSKPSEDYKEMEAPLSFAHPSSIIDYLSSIIMQESAALDSLARSLSFSLAFSHAPNSLSNSSAQQRDKNHVLSVLQLLHSLSGRIILSGMGKCGHIANKLAATFASTGTPASFIHPAEASHGDLGMISKSDAVIVLSNSGNTSELNDIIDYTRRLLVPLIALTSNDNSRLAQAADYVLLLPAIPEACPLGLAPTTSTAMMLGLGDALALTLLRLKGFSSDDFRQLHPGGKIGKMLLRAGDIMHSSLPLVTHREAMQKAIIEMSAKSFGCVGVVDQDQSLLGIITDGDLRRHMSSNLLDLPVTAVMTANPVSISSTTLVSAALALMNQNKISSVFVLDQNKKPTGIIHLHDCLRAGIN